MKKSKVQELADKTNALPPEDREIVKGIVNLLIDIEKVPDIFQWANQADAQKNEMQLAVYVFTKNFTAYSVRHAKELEPYLRATFLYDLINSVTMGAATGLKIRDIHNDDGATENVIDVVGLSTVQNAQSLIEQLAYSPEQIEEFSHAEHDTKRIAGIVLSVTPTDKKAKPFFIVKQLQQSNILQGGASWSWHGGKLAQNPLDAAVKVATDNQTLVIGEHVFVFNVAKFTRLFGYDAKKKAVLDGKISEIAKQFKLSFPDGLDMETLVKSNAQLAEKLLRSEPLGITQEQVIEQADKFQLALMTDDNGAIIIMDGRDATMFANLLNDDYVESDMTDKHYLAVKKKEVFDTEDKQLNLGA